MSGALLVLTHPAVPLAWWAANSPPVVELLSQALGDSGEGSRRLKSDEEQEMQFQIMMAVGLGVGILVPIVFWVIFASMYKGQVTDKRGNFPSELPEDFSLARKDFKYGLFSCCEDTQYLLHGCCAGTVRAADTFQAVSASSFWCVVVAFLLTWFIAQAIGAAIVLGLRRVLPARIVDSNLNNQGGQIGWFVADACLALWLAGLRKQLRASLGDTTPDGSFFGDCLKYWWCSWCTIVQDARQVDGAQNIRVECCCNMIKTVPAAAGVGGAIVVGRVVA